MLIRTSACVLVLGFTLTAAGCGDDEEAAPDAPSAPVVTTQEGGTAELPPATDGTETASREDQEGGAGDEEEARSEVELEFSQDGGLEPPLVRVAPFIAVKLIVRSTDGSEYNLSVSGPTSGGGAAGSTETAIDLEGLRRGQKYEVRERRTGSVTAIVASDEVGP